MANTIEDAIAQAQAAAGNVSREADANMGNHMTVSSTGTAVSTTPNRGAPIDFEDLDQGAINVVGWLKLSKYGVQVGNDETLFKEMDVVIDLGLIAHTRAIKYGNPAQYRKTYNGQIEARGGSWLQTLLEAQKIDPKANEYASADIPLYPVEDMKSKDGKILVAAGDAVGFSLNTTAWRGYAAWIKGLKRKGVDLKNDKVRLKLTAIVRKNDKGTWGEFTYGDSEVVDSLPGFDGSDD